MIQRIERAIDRFLRTPSGGSPSGPAAALILLVALVVMTGCPTLPPAQKEGRVENLLQELNTAELERVMELTNAPFLLDGEIVDREADIERLWTNLREQGFAFEPPTVSALRPARPADFPDTFEVRSFFEQYVPDGAGLATVDTQYGTFLLLTGGRKWFTPKIVGFTGPVSEPQGATGDEVGTGDGAGSVDETATADGTGTGGDAGSDPDTGGAGGADQGGAG